MRIRDLINSFKKPISKGKELTQSSKTKAYTEGANVYGPTGPNWNTSHRSGSVLVLSTQEFSGMRVEVVTLDDIKGLRTVQKFDDVYMPDIEMYELNANGRFYYIRKPDVHVECIMRLLIGK